MKIRKQPSISPTQAGMVKMCTSVGDPQSLCYKYILFYSSYLCSFTVLFLSFCRSLSVEESPLKIYSVIKFIMNMASRKCFFLKFNKVISKCAHPIFNSSMYYILNKKFKTIVTVGDMCSFLLSS